MSETSPPRLKALGAYIFAGGFTVGMSKHFDVTAHFEDGDFGVDTFKLNFPNVPVFTQKDKWPIEMIKDVDVVYGNPACSGWSVLGTYPSATKAKPNWRQKVIENGALQFFNLWDATRPKVWAMESVTQMLTKGWDSFVVPLTHRALNAGYSVTYLLTDTKFLGLGQSRRRAFMIFHTVELDFEVPTFTPVTIMDVLKDVKDPGPIEPMSDFVKYWLDRAGPKEGPRQAWERENPGGTGGPLFVLHRMKPDSPVGAIFSYAHMAMVHPFEDRYLGLNELLALMGYPPDFKWSSLEFAGEHRPVYPEMAKAVTPAAGEYLGWNLRHSLENVRPITSPRVYKVSMVSSKINKTDYKILGTREDLTGLLERLRPAQAVEIAA